MPATYKVKQGQCLADVCMQNYGTLEDLALLAVANGLGVTDALPVGLSIVLPELTTNKKVLRAFEDYDTLVAVDANAELIDYSLYVDEDYWTPEDYA